MEEEVVVSSCCVADLSVVGISVGVDAGDVRLGVAVSEVDNSVVAGGVVSGVSGVVSVMEGVVFGISGVVSGVDKGVDMDGENDGDTEGDNDDGDVCVVVTDSEVVSPMVDSMEVVGCFGVVSVGGTSHPCASIRNSPTPPSTIGKTSICMIPTPLPIFSNPIFAISCLN